VVIEIRRESDNELCGHVRPLDGAWVALTVFGGTLGTHATRTAAEDHVHAEGLASLAERWMFRPDPAADWQVVCIQEANPDSVRLALDYYSMPGVPTVVVSKDQLSSGAMLVRDQF
jgi:hypothetical protein